MNSDYERVYREFNWQVPDYFNFGFDVTDRWADDPARKLMIYVDEQEQQRNYFYSELHARSNQFANLLASLGLKRGERVLVLLPRIPQWWEVMIGMIKGGQIAMPATTQLTGKDILYRVETAGARAVITDYENAEKFDQIRQQIPGIEHFFLIDDRENHSSRDGWHDYEKLIEGMDTEISDAARVRSHKDDSMLLYFTSGTTGFPKMVLHTHSSYPIGHQVTGKLWLDLKPEDLHWNLSDTGWAKAAWSNLFGPLNTGSTLFTHNTKGKFSAVDTLKHLSGYGITSFCAPPTAYRLLIVEDLAAYDLSSLRSCIAAGEPLNPEIIEQWRAKTGMTIREGYGQTETVVLVGNYPGMKIKPGSMGRPSPGFIVDVIGDDGEVLPTNKEGDIGVKIKPARPVGIFKEYWNDPVADQAAIRGDWYITGDRAVRDEEGYLWFVGRADDVIISAGYRIGPFEVESSLIEHPAVLEAAVVAKPDVQRGEIVKAFVILKPGFQGSDMLAHEIQDFVKKITAPYKYPREIEFVTELPKTISGKIRRVELRQRSFEEKNKS